MDRDIVGRLVELKRFRANQAEEAQRSARQAGIAAVSAAEAAIRTAAQWTEAMPARAAAIYAPLIGRIVDLDTLEAARQATLALRVKEEVLLQQVEEARARLREAQAAERAASAALAEARRGVEKFVELVRVLRQGAAREAAREEDAVMEEVTARHGDDDPADGLDEVPAWERNDGYDRAF
ncbi:YscO family type III secretion system apparatus protein [Belnapia sp. T18]|uniref:YscO family type III secretion system apparatus protein n=1 Tax=Belnapia arida TaxID=2804533 RepID=A0ABS1U7U8_9PROT|nr:YscO family type III secretion system apparatus protein [Belnapia arida]MBL6080034.1 YscO family type III secretion system apparatus protein [Belnapia arida]